MYLEINCKNYSQCEISLAINVSVGMRIRKLLHQIKKKLYILSYVETPKMLAKSKKWCSF